MICGLNLWIYYHSHPIFTKVVDKEPDLDEFLITNIPKTKILFLELLKVLIKKLKINRRKKTLRIFQQQFWVKNLRIECFWRKIIKINLIKLSIIKWIVFIKRFISLYKLPFRVLQYIIDRNSSFFSIII